MDFFENLIGGKLKENYYDFVIEDSLIYLGKTYDFSKKPDIRLINSFKDDEYIFKFLSEKGFYSVFSVVDGISKIDYDKLNKEIREIFTLINFGFNTNITGIISDIDDLKFVFESDGSHMFVRHFVCPETNIYIAAHIKFLYNTTLKKIVSEVIFTYYNPIHDSNSFLMNTADDVIDFLYDKYAKILDKKPEEITAEDSQILHMIFI